MPIKYKYVAYKNQWKEEETENCIRPQVLVEGNASTAQIVKEMVSRNYYVAAEASKAIVAVFETIETLLRKGKSVTIEGYGTFSPSAQFVKTKVSNDIPSKKRKAQLLRAESIEVKNINFNATPLMKRRLGENNFVRSNPKIVQP